VARLARGCACNQGDDAVQCGQPGGAVRAVTWWGRSPSGRDRYLFLAALAPVLSMVDVTERRLPNQLTVGSYPVLAAALVIAAAITDDCRRLLRATIGSLRRPCSI